MKIESLSPIYNTQKDSNIYKILSIFKSQIEKFNLEIEVLNSLYNIKKHSGKILDAIGVNLLFSRRGLPDEDYQKMLLITYMLRTGDVSIEAINTIMKNIFSEKYIGCWDYTISSSTHSGNKQFFDGSRYLEGSWYLSGTKKEPNYFEIVVKKMNLEELSFFESILKIIKPAGIKYYILNLK